MRSVDKNVHILLQSNDSVIRFRIAFLLVCQKSDLVHLLSPRLGIQGHTFVTICSEQVNKLL